MQEDTTSGQLDLRLVYAEVDRLREQFKVGRKCVLRYALEIPARTIKVGANRPDMLYDLHSALFSSLAGTALLLLPAHTVELLVCGLTLSFVGINRWLAALYGNFEWHKAACLLSAMTWGVISAFFFTHNQLGFGIVITSFIPFSVIRYLQIVRGGRSSGRQQ